MKLALITLAPPLDPQAPVTGNQVRADFLSRGLQAAGMEVVQAHTGDGGLDDGAAVAGWLEWTRPDAILAGYWKILESLPQDPGCPVIADCVAPRPLEQAIADPAAADLFLARYLDALARADLVLTGNRRQRILMTGWLLTRDPAPADVLTVPLGCNPAPQRRGDYGGRLVLVSGGRDWPWRDSRAWDRTLAEGLDPERVQIHHFGEPGPESSGRVHHSLTAYSEWRAFLRTDAHAGLELADANLEREASQSFRAMACLEAGVPLILNDYLELADAVTRHGAGFAVATRADAVAAARALADSVRLREERARGARELAGTFHAEHVLAPLVQWLDTPRRRVRKTTGGPSSTARLEAESGIAGRLGRMLLAPFKRRVEGDGVVVITRSDLFPADHGAAVKILETARGLARCGRSVAIVTAERGHYYRVDADGIHRERLPLWLAAVAPPRALSHLLVRLKGLPASNAFLYWPVVDPFYGLRTAWVGRRIGASTWLAEFPGYAQAARIARRLNGGVALLAEHNVEYLRLAEQVAGLGERAFAKLKSIELNLAASMNAVVTVSDADRRTLIGEGLDAAGVVTIPHGVDLAGFRETAPMARDALGLDPDKPVLAYHGTFSYPPNRQAVTLLAEEILPRLADRGLHCQVLAIGRQPPRAVGHPDIHFPGSMQSLGGALKACDLAVVPLVSGGGTRMKILDYFAAGLAVVSTAKGCEGLPVTDERELCIRDDWDGFAEAVAGLLRDPDRRERIAGGGREMAAGLDWRMIGQRYDALVRRLQDA